MAKCVWLLTSGSYSDYRVLAVFANEADAQAVAAAEPELEVEEFEFYDTPLVPGVLFEATVDNAAPSTWNLTVPGEVYVRQVLAWPWHPVEHERRVWAYEGRCWARVVDEDRERAVKTASDLYVAEMVKRGFAAAAPPTAMESMSARIAASLREEIDRNLAAFTNFSKGV